MSEDKSPASENGDSDSELHGQEQEPSPSKEDGDTSDELGVTIERFEESNKVESEAETEAETRTGSDAASTDKVRPAAKSNMRRILKFFLSLVIVVVLALCVVAAIYFVNMNSQKSEQQARVIDELSQRLTEIELSSRRFIELQSQTESIIAENNRRLNNRLDTTEQALEAQRRRLLAMSTTTRDDWLLAEAEYLLKLGNQRVLVERKADSAIALFEEADAILRDLADPKLFPLRDAIKKDIVALKLAKSIDVEGIYLELAALADQVESLPLLPQAFNYKKSEAPSDEAGSGSESSSLRKFLESFKNYARVIKHEDKPAAILPPDETAYLHLNLRLMLERAQLALLREQQDIYISSLEEADKWLSRYFPSSDAAESYQQALRELSQRQVIRVLPDVSASLALLKSYISDLHQLKTPAPKQSSDEAL